VAIFGFELTEAQRQAMEEIWAAALELELSELDAVSAPPALVEATYQLLALLWTDADSEALPERKAIVHFSGVLGIHPLSWLTGALTITRLSFLPSSG
jgi:hypothetical protein